MNNLGKRSLLCCAVLVASLAMAEEDHVQLPPEIQVDRLLVQATRENSNGHYWSAVSTLERILAVYEEHALAIPTDFWFRQAEVLQNAGLHKRAANASTRYLREAGREGDYYRKALEVLDAAENALDKARWEAERARARIEREERTAATRAAAISAVVPDTIVIPEGKFRMGCLSRQGCRKEEKPVREVHIEKFALSKYEVTIDQWNACREWGGDCASVSVDSDQQDGNFPIVNVSWLEVQTYLSWLSELTGESFRLPSEAEWEYAARAGTETNFWWGDDISARHVNCSNDDCDRWLGSRTVGSYPENPFGLHDMNSNVLEWVQDCWYKNYKSAPTDGRARESRTCRLRVVRGGRSADRWSRCESWQTWCNSERLENLGFRVAQSLGN